VFIDVVGNNLSKVTRHGGSISRMTMNPVILRFEDDLTILNIALES